MPWDLRGVPAQLGGLLCRRGVSGHALIPRCGSAYDVRAFVRAGWEVLAVDLSDEGIGCAPAGLADLAHRVTRADFFQDAHDGPHDVVYERWQVWLRRDQPGAKTKIAGAS